MSAPWAVAATWLQLALATVDVLFLALIPYHLGRVYRASIKVYPSWQGRLKIVSQYVRCMSRDFV